jgi:hypothetical protein
VVTPEQPTAQAQTTPAKPPVQEEERFSKTALGRDYQR